MLHTAYSSDTSKEAFARMTDRWAVMSTVEKAELFDAMCLEVDEIARLGIAATEGKLTPERENYLMMERRYGTALAIEVLGAEPLR
jgi:hypothetical protein